MKLKFPKLFCFQAEVSEAKASEADVSEAEVSEVEVPQAEVSESEVPEAEVSWGLSFQRLGEPLDRSWGNQLELVRFKGCV